MTIITILDRPRSAHIIIITLYTIQYDIAYTRYNNYSKSVSYWFGSPRASLFPTDLARWSCCWCKHHLLSADSSAAMCYARAQLNIQLWRNRTTTYIHYSVRSWKSQTHTHTLYLDTHCTHKTCVCVLNNEFRAQDVPSVAPGRCHTRLCAEAMPPDVSERSSSSRNRALGCQFSFIFF